MWAVRGRVESHQQNKLQLKLCFLPVWFVGLRLHCIWSCGHIEPHSSRKPKPSYTRHLSCFDCFPLARISIVFASCLCPVLSNLSVARFVFSVPTQFVLVGITTLVAFHWHSAFSRLGVERLTYTTSDHLKHWRAHLIRPVVIYYHIFSTCR